MHLFSRSAVRSARGSPITHHSHGAMRFPYFALRILLFGSIGVQSTLGVLTNADGEPINQGASSSFSPWNSMVLSDGWTVHVSGESDITQWVPIEWTAAPLENFYQRLFEIASHNFWASSAPSSTFAFRQGALNLYFLPIFSSVPVPWHVIAQFAWAMLAGARRGYTAGFNVRLQSPQDKQSGPNNGWSAILLARPGSDSQELQGGDSSPPDAQSSGSESDEEAPCKRHCPRERSEPT